MRLKLQFAGWLLALGMCGAMAAPGLAQRPHVNRVQNRPANRPTPPKQQAKQQQKRQAQKQAQAERRQNGTANRPPAAKANQAGGEARTNSNPNRPPSANTPPTRKFNELTPQEQKKVVDSYNKQKNLTPSQRQEINDRVKNWNNLTQQQKDHIRNDVMPKWRQMPVERRQAIRQRLQILQNMPESARNQHLNDSNFTRGMSEEDKATLKDLSHMHVGGAPDPPSE